VRFGGETLSTLDLCKPEQFTLLARTRGSAWMEAAATVAAELGVPIAAYRVGLGGDVADLYGVWGDASETGETGCLLVRPDQVVAWRRGDLAQDPAGALASAVRSCLSMGSTARAAFPISG
jgi:2,4-dichlorophenol 6-monooxygenase